MESVFFDKQGLSTTSANFIANLAKEHYQECESYLNNLQLYNESVSLIDSNTSKPIKFGESNIERINYILNKLSKLKSLIAWLREAIKKKQELYELSQTDSYILNEFNLEYPTSPVFDEVLTEEKYFDSLSIKERNRYFSLETQAAVYGECVHKTLNKVRKQYLNILSNPNKIEGEGRDAVIYSYTPTISKEVVEDTFMKLQQKYREVQAELNSMRTVCQNAISESKIKAQTKYNCEYDNYMKECEKISLFIKEKKQIKAKEINELKIVIPNDLQEIYSEVKSLGK